MPTRNIRLSAEAYNRLVSLKLEGESFTDIIIRLTVNFRILDLVGLWDDDVGEDVEYHMREFRESLDESLEARWRRMPE